MHTDTHAQQDLCDSEGNTTSASVKFILTQVIKKGATWEKFVLWQHFKSSLKISEKDLFIDGNNGFFLWIFSTAQLLSVFTCWLTLCMQDLRS